MHLGAALGFLSFSLALLWAALSVPAAIRLGHRRSLLVTPRLYGRSGKQVTYLGGCAVAFATLAGMASQPRALVGSAAVVAGSLAYGALGLIDDRLTPRGGLAAPVRLAAGSMISAGAWLAGVRVQITGRPLPDAVLTIVFLTGVANSLNLLDNMDGLAAATAIPAAAAIAIIGIAAGRPQQALLSACLAGACCGFLPFNFPRARVYLGDSGALFIGFSLGAGALMSAPQKPGAGFLVGIAVLAVPLADTTIRQLHRWISGRSLVDVSSGIDHISHRLADKGVRPATVTLLHFAAGACAAAAAVASAVSANPAPAAVAVAIFAIFGTASALPTGNSDRFGARKLAVAASGGVFAVLALGVAPTVAAAGHLGRSADYLRSARASVRVLDGPGASTAFLRAERASLMGVKELESPLLGPARLLPVLGQNLKAVESISWGTALMAEAGRAAADAAGRLAGSRRPLFESGSVDIDSLGKAGPPLKAAARRARRAVSEVASAKSPVLLGPVGSAHRQFVNVGGAAARGLSRAAEAVSITGDLLGAGATRTWFLALENSAELRATGGLIGAFGILRAEGGHLTLERLEPDRNLPQTGHGVPEAVSERYRKLGSHRLWENVNMSPDFPTTARTVMALWKDATGQSLDGVVAIDVAGLANLLRIVGSQEIPGLGPVDAGNLAKAALSDAYLKIPSRPQRQDVLAEAAARVWASATQQRFSLGPNEMRLLSRTVKEKHVMVFSDNHAAALARLGLSGPLLDPGIADYLMVVGQNASENKLDFYLRRTIDYRVTISADGVVKGDLTVRLANTTPRIQLPSFVVGPFSATGVNRSYLSVYLPRASGLNAASLNGVAHGLESQTEKGLSVVSGFMDVERGGSSTMRLALTRRMRPGAHDYRLIVQRQPTLYPDILRLEIALPPGVRPLAKSPQMRAVGSRLIYRGPLKSDSEFSVRF